MIAHKSGSSPAAFNDTNTINLIKEQTSQLNKINNETSDYFKKIEDTIKSYHPDVYAIFVSSIEIINKLFGCIESRLSGDLKQYIEIYDYIKECEVLLLDMQNVINNDFYNKKLFIGMSISYIEALKLERDNIQRMIAKYKAKKIVANKEIFQKISENLTNGNDLIQLIDRSNDLTIFITKEIVRKELLPYSAIKNRLEIFKELALNVVVATAGGNEWDQLSVLLSNHGLVPITELMKESDICEYVCDIMAIPRAKSISDLSKTLRKQNIGIIIINKKLGNKQYEFDIRPIIDEKYVLEKNLSVSNVVLTDKLLERYDTIKVHENKSSKGGNSYDISYRKEGKFNDNLILESTVDNKYRLLTVSGSNCNIIAKHSVDNITLRPHVYHEIMIDRVTTGLQENYESILKNFESISKTADSSMGVKELVLSDCMKWFEDLLSKELPNNYIEFKSMITNDTVYEDIITKRLSGLESLVEKPVEGIITFAHTLTRLIKDFAKELSYNYGKQIELIKEDIFSNKKSAEIAKILTELYKNILNETIERLDSNPSKWKKFDTTLKEFYFYHR